MAYHVVRSSELEWVTRPHEPDEAPRHAGPVTDAAGFTHTRGTSGATSRAPRAGATAT